MMLDAIIDHEKDGHAVWSKTFKKDDSQLVYHL
jgi:hypothetical protein